MKDLIFELKVINYSFILKPEDLFFIENSKKYFKVLPYLNKFFWLKIYKREIFFIKY